MRTLLFITFTALTLLSAMPLLAETYRYTDSQGGLHFVDDLANVPKKYRKNVRTMDNQPVTNVMDTPAARPASKARRPAGVQSATAEAFSGTVEVYVTSWCGYCKKTIAYLSSKGIPFATYDIEKDDTARQRYQELGGSGVPVIRIGDKVIRGFNPQAIDAYVGR
jgi:glutaredoxin-like YruB-family protein